MNRLSDYVNKYREIRAENQFGRFRVLPNAPFFFYIYGMPRDRNLIQELEALSAQTLSRRDDLALILELAGSPDVRQPLDDLSFHSKVVHRTAAIIKRLGPDGAGVDQVRGEFSRSLDVVRSLLARLLPLLPEGARGRMDREYLSMTQVSLGNLMMLCSDLRWYKNWLIDNRTAGGAE
jgi:hypothetical protein